MRLPMLPALLLVPLPAAALELDCVAERACVSGAEVGCEAAEVPYKLSVGRNKNAKVVMTTEDDQSFYEFRRLPDHDGLILQAAGGALDEGQGAGALSVFADGRFVLTRHSRIVTEAGSGESEILAVSIHGRCAEADQ